MSNDDKSLVIREEETVVLAEPKDQRIAMTPQFADQLAKAIGSVHPLSMDGTNAFHHYDYPTIAQVRGNAGQALAQAGIGIVPEIVKWGRDKRETGSGKTSNVTFVQLRMRLFSPNGQLEVGWGGESEDMTDKGLQKAVSAGVKSFLMAFLLMPYGEDENDDGKTDAEIRKQKPAPAPRPVTPTPVPQNPAVQDPKAGGGSAMTTPQSTASEQKSDPPKPQQNAVQTCTERPYPPEVIKAKLQEWAGKNSEKFNALGGKERNAYIERMETKRKGIAPFMESAFTDLDANKRMEKRHGVLQYLVNNPSVKAEAMPVWVVEAFAKWLFGNANVSFKAEPNSVVVKEIIGIEHAVVLAVEPEETFESLCVKLGVTPENAQAHYRAMWGEFDQERATLNMKVCVNTGIKIDSAGAMALAQS